MSEVWIVQYAEKEATPGDPGLTPRGVGQADSVARHLKGRVFGGVVSSPLVRAKQTAQVIADERGYSVKIDGRLTERVNRVDSDQSLDEFLAEWERSTRERDYEPRGGTSSRVAGESFLQGCADAIRSAVDQDMVVVSHGGVTTDALCNLVSDEALLGHSVDILTDVFLTVPSQCYVLSATNGRSSE